VIPSFWAGVCSWGPTFALRATARQARFAKATARQDLKFQISDLKKDGHGFCRPIGGCYETQRNSLVYRKLLQKSVGFHFCQAQEFLLGSIKGMELPAVGTCELLRVLSPRIPDDFINEHLARQRREGRRLRFSSTQLWRVHLLVLLTRTFSFNALIRCLREQESWRRFAHLPNRFAIPDVRMLNDFRRALGVAGFRQINDHLVWELLKNAPLNPTTVAFIDATDLPASAEDKKNKPEVGLHFGRHWEHALGDRAKPVFLSVIKNTRCDCGLAATTRQSCWHLWCAGPHRRMCLKATCLSPASGIAEGGSTGGRRSWRGIWDTFIRKPNDGCAPTGKSPSSRA